MRCSLQVPNPRRVSLTTQDSVDGDTVTKCVDEVCVSNDVSDRSTWSPSDLTSVPPKAAGEHPTSDGKWTVDENGASALREWDSERAGCSGCP